MQSRSDGASLRLAARVLRAGWQVSVFRWWVPLVPLPPGHLRCCNPRCQVAEVGSSFSSASVAVECIRQAEQGSRLHCHVALLVSAGVVLMNKLVEAVGIVPVALPQPLWLGHGAGSVMASNLKLNLQHQAVSRSAWQAE